MKKSMLDLSKYQDEILDIINNLEEFTTSDLQGVLSVITKNIYDEGYKDGACDMFDEVRKYEISNSIYTDISDDLTKILK